LASLGKDEIVALLVLSEKGESNRETARRLGVSEGAVRYHLRRQLQQVPDGRKKTCLIVQLGLGAVVEHWWRMQVEVLPEGRPPNVNLLWQRLVQEHDYGGSYKSVRKYVRTQFPAPKLRPFRRVETPPGAQTQSDWLEMTLDLGDAGPTKLYGFLMTLSHSRMSAVVWSRSMNQLAWHQVHNAAFQRLGGVAAVNRIDNLKTGVSRGAGPWGQINDCYRSYARTMGFHVDPHEARQPQQKGKAERRVGAFKRLELSRRFDSLEALQSSTDEQLQRDARRRTCPVTGRSVFETWQSEKELLRPLPATLPEPFDLIRSCPVHKDATVRFEGRTYSVPFEHVQGQLEVRGCNGFLQVVHPKTGEILRKYPRGTEQRLLIDPSCYAGDGTETVALPRPLGRMSRKLEEIAALPVQLRSIEIYAQLAEVAK
jgi:transposase